MIFSSCQQQMLRCDVHALWSSSVLSLKSRCHQLLMSLQE